MHKYSQAKGQRGSAKERKEQHSVSVNSLSHPNSKSSSQSNIPAPLKMSPNPSNTYHLTRGAGGNPIDPSAYTLDLDVGDPQSGSTSGSSGSQLAQNSTSNTSGQQGNNNQGANSASNPQSHGGSTHGSNVHPSPQMGAFLGQPQGQAPWTTYSAGPSQSSGGFQGQGSAAGTGQGGAQGGGYGGGNAAGGTSGYDNGWVDSMSAARSQSGPGR